MIREFNGTVYAVPSGRDAGQRSEPIILNDTGRILWQKLLGETDEAALADALMSEYDIDRAVAEADVAEFISGLRSADMLE